MYLKCYTVLNPFYERFIYFLTGICLTLDGLFVVLTLGFWTPQLSRRMTVAKGIKLRQKMTKIRQRGETSGVSTPRKRGFHNIKQDRK